MKFTFRTKILLIFISVIILICCTTAIFIRRYDYNREKNQLYLSAQNQSYQIDNYISGLLEQVKNNVKFLSGSSSVTKADSSVLALFNMNSSVIPKKYSKNIPGLESEIYTVLESYGETHPDTQYAYMGTIWGGYISYPDGLVVNQYDPRVRPWYIQAIMNPGKVTISDPYADYSSPDNIVISASTVINNNSGKLVGVIGLDVSLVNLSKKIQNENVSDGSYTFIFTRDGTIIAHPDKTLNFKNIRTLSTTGYHKDSQNKNIIYNISDYKKLIDENSGNFETTINGEEVLINLYTSSKTGWKIATVIPKSTLISGVNDITYFIIFITIFVIIASAFFISFVSKKITEPISSLMGMMQSAENGNLDVQVDIKTRDEFKKLGDCFNSMIKKLRSNYTELSAIYEQLSASEEEIKTQYEELQYNQEVLRKSEERHRLALDGSNDSIWELDLEKGEFFVSDKFYEMTGYPISNNHKLKAIFNALVHPEDKKKAINDFFDHINNNTDFYQSEFRIKNKDNSYIWIYNRGKALRNRTGKVIKIAGSTTDITERKISEKKILYMAHYDLLTNLPNRTYFINRLKEHMALAMLNKAKGAVFFIDLDNFKNINDTMGHDNGDKLLKKISVQLMGVMSSEDVVCRLGGDEFVIMHPYKNKEEVVEFADKVLNLFNNVFEIEEKQIYTSASVGIALYPKDGTDAGSILKNADAAMYKAKEAGKNRFILYNEEIYLNLERKTHIEKILRAAIQNKELHVYYQPQYNPMSNEIYGFEALLRLNSKELGFISPAEFIPVAEETGYINKIGEWVFTEVCKQSYIWLQKGFKFSSMSINISSVQINQTDFYETIKKIIEDTKIKAEIIELEITETCLMQSIDTSIDILEKLMKMGLRIALDDFGTGYSSLNYLRKIPLSTLKVDKSFIDNISSGTKEGAIIANIIEMAHGMGLKVIAEGVEKEQQLITLKNINCDYIQGYYYSKPLPPDKIEPLFMGDGY